MLYRICKECNGRCDPGEMIGNVCVECLEEEKQMQMRASTVTRIMNSPFFQMELNTEVIEDGRKENY